MGRGSYETSAGVPSVSSLPSFIYMTRNLTRHQVRRGLGRRIIIICCGRLPDCRRRPLLRREQAAVPKYPTYCCHPPGRKAGSAESIVGRGGGKTPLLSAHGQFTSR